MPYRLSRAADADLDRLYEWGIDHHGEDAADRYFDGLLQRFEEIAAAPLQWQAVDHIRAGYRRSVYRSDAIYFRIETGFVLIVRILRHQDPETELSG